MDTNTGRTDGVKIFYLRDKNRFPVGCVASRLKMKDVLFSVATYNPKDEFNKKLARNIAIQMLEKTPWSLAIGSGIKKRIMEKILTLPVDTASKRERQGFSLKEKKWRTINAELNGESARVTGAEFKPEHYVGQRAHEAARLWLQEFVEKKPHDITLSFEMDSEQYQQIQVVAFKRKQSPGDIIHEAIAGYLAQLPDEAKTTKQQQKMKKAKIQIKQ